MLGVLRQKFSWDGHSLHDARQELEKFANKVATTELFNIIDYDPPDNRILECAAAAGSDFIITEDKDLLRLKIFRNSRILNLSDFMAQSFTQGRSV